MQSSLLSKSHQPLHVAIIMDGNGRWAALQGLPRHAGHRAGVEALRQAITAAPGAGIGTLTVYAFSSDNWRRPPREVDLLMGLLAGYLANEVGQLVKNGVRLSVIGRRDRLNCDIAAAITRAERATAGGTRLQLRIAIDYSARDAILAAAKVAVVAGTRDLSREDFSRLLSGSDAPGDVDLVIRTSGELRLSDFLLWECAYAELYFTDVLWPDFTPYDLRAALTEFYRRDRRFGGSALACESASAGEDGASVAAF